MASRRIKKKQAKRQEQIRRSKEIRNLIEQTTGKSSSITKNSAANLRRLERQTRLKGAYKKGMTAEELRNKQKHYIGRQTMETSDAADDYVAIKTYYDFVNDGIINQVSGLSKYDMKDYLDDILNDEYINDMNKEAQNKKVELIEKSKEKARMATAKAQAEGDLLNSWMDF